MNRFHSIIAMFAVVLVLSAVGCNRYPLQFVERPGPELTQEWKEETWELAKALPILDVTKYVVSDSEAIRLVQEYFQGQYSDHTPLDKDDPVQTQDSCLDWLQGRERGQPGWETDTTPAIWDATLKNDGGITSWWVHVWKSYNPPRYREWRYLHPPYEPVEIGMIDHPVTIMSTLNREGEPYAFLNHPFGAICGSGPYDIKDSIVYPKPTD